MTIACIKCKYVAYKRGWVFIKLMCGHPKVIDPVTGKADQTCIALRSDAGKRGREASNCTGPDSFLREDPHDRQD